MYLADDIIKLMDKELTSGYDFRGTPETGLTVEYAWNIGKAFAEWLPTAGGVIVTTIPSQQAIARAITEGLRLQGRSVIDGGAGDHDVAKAYIKDAGLSGAAVIRYDDLEKLTTIELFQDESRLIDSETGLHDIRELADAGNFVPAAVKGELTALA